MRIKIIRLFIIVSFSLVVLSLFYLQVIRGNYYFKLSVNNRIRIISKEAPRGQILDRQGKLLADNQMSYQAAIMPQTVEDLADLMNFLSEVLGVNSKTLLQRYYAKKNTPFTPVIIAENIDKIQAIKIEENVFRFPSLSVQESFKRFYPLRENAAHLLGYVGKIDPQQLSGYKNYGYTPLSVVGKSGIEEYYDDYLKGQEGGSQIEVDSRGRQVRLLSFKESVKGTDISLTVDQRLQQLSAQLLEGKPGAVIVMDNDNGEILSLASSPSFDPNIFLDSSRSKETGFVLSNESSPLLNRAIKGLFPPGSVFKVILSIAGLDSKKITENTTYFCPSYYELGGIVFGCTHTHNNQNLIQAIAHSCNVYFYHLGLTIGADVIYNYAHMFGLGTRTNIDLPYEALGNIPNRQKRFASSQSRWFPGDTLNFSIGQGDVVLTPIQLVKMMATVSNDGVEVSPHLIQTINGEAVTDFNHKKNIPIPAEVFHKVKIGLRQCVTDEQGTGHALDQMGFEVAGKTGTAQSSGSKPNHAWFVGYALTDKRKISFCVFLEHGISSYNAVLISRQLLEGMRQFDLL